jgi:hypothetical protein
MAMSRLGRGLVGILLKVPAIVQVAKPGSHPSKDAGFGIDSIRHQ